MAGAAGPTAATAGPAGPLRTAAGPAAGPDAAHEIARQVVPGITCPELHSQVSFCGTPADWQRLSLPVPETLGLWQYAGDGFGKVILQEGARGEAVTASSVEQAILARVNGQVSGGGEVQVLSQGGGRVGGTRGDLVGTILYAFKSQGARMLTLHSYLVAQDLVMQFITVTRDRRDRSAARAMHRDFLSQFCINAPETLL